MSKKREFILQALPDRNRFLEDLFAKDNFAEVILTAWGMMEYLMDGILLQEYRLSGMDYRGEPLLGLDFESKLQLQKKVGLVSKAEWKIAHDFQERRNRLFHKGGFWFVNLTVQEKRQLAEMAIKAAQVVDGVQLRIMHSSYKELPWLNPKYLRTANSDESGE